MADHAATEARIAQARERLASKLTELQTRVTHVKSIVSPRTYLENPWVQLGIGAAVGFFLGGRVPPSHRLMPGPSEPGAAPTRERGIFGSAVRGAIISIATSVLRRAVTEVLRSVDADRDKADAAGIQSAPAPAAKPAP